jgi:hypothetical protein
MGKIKNGFSSGFTGKVGNVIGSHWRGIDVIRARADHRRDANTLKQQGVREKFKAIQELTHNVMGSLIMPIWNDKLKKTTGCNRFMQANYQAFNTFGEIEDYAKLVLSYGKLPKVYNMLITPDETKEDFYNLTWENERHNELAKDEDMLRVFMMDAEDSSYQVFELPDTATRKDKLCAIDLSAFKDCIVEVYLFFSDAEMKEFTPSTHYHLEL